MLMASLVVLHLLAALVWVGGMFFAHSALRPTAASVLQPPERLTLISGVFGRFFVWVKGAILLLFLSGFGLIHMLSGFGKLGWYVHAMLLIAVVMTVIFAYIYGGPFRIYKLDSRFDHRSDWCRRTLPLVIVLGIADNEEV